LFSSLLLPPPLVSFEAKPLWYLYWSSVMDFWTYLAGVGIFGYFNNFSYHCGLGYWILFDNFSEQPLILVLIEYKTDFWLVWGQIIISLILKLVYETVTRLVLPHLPCPYQG
jgi:hypothetical protein